MESGVDMAKRIYFSQWVELYYRLIKFGWSTEEIISFTKARYGSFYLAAKPYLNYDANDGID